MQIVAASADILGRLIETQIVRPASLFGELVKPVCPQARGQRGCLVTGEELLHIPVTGPVEPLGQRLVVEIGIKRVVANTAAQPVKFIHVATFERCLRFQEGCPLVLQPGGKPGAGYRDGENEK